MLTDQDVLLSRNPRLSDALGSAAAPCTEKCAMAPFRCR